MKLKIQPIDKVRSAGILFLIGLLMGVIFANFFKEYFLDDLQIIDVAYYEFLNNTELNYINLLKYTVIDYFKEFGIFWIMCFTVLGIPYIVFTILKKGFHVGYMISSLVLIYNTKGIFLYFSYLIPQVFVYIIVLFVSLNKGYELAHRSYANRHNHVPFGKNRIMEYVALFLTLSALLIIAAVLETYFGTTLIRKTLKLCL